MKLYLLSLGAGLLVGVVYSLLGVRSPAPPIIALVGLLGILAGEQVVPIARRALQGQDIACYLRGNCADHVLGQLPGNPDKN
ncbi:XapX domain-containing protein [Novosphingobium sp. SG751A]|uniref:XapX domain-containing protein n=1 Tax=Novosphingobium sp. SG751A TaxID=2587000 RepID=UPI0015582D82|nr:XapX domain-containing protein [Novosphingobium sp. SG751A]NOW47410.1 XapX domain-containing protein [Novosphingobium sp. SG751A]